MYKLVEVSWESKGELHCGDAIVEYVVIWEDDERCEEITGILCPEYMPEHWRETCKEQAKADFTQSIKGGY
jgi:hypothetical protein